MKVLKRVLLWTLLILGLAAAGFAIYCAVTASQAKLDVDKLQLREQTIRICDRNGEPLAGGNSEAAYSELPAHVVNAFVAIEDKRFWEHSGVDYRRIAGAAWHNLRNRSLAEGGSTITQQLIKNTHLSRSKTLSRKIQEIKLAYDLERAYSKEEILTLYLNKIYFGNGVYGIADAARFYFDKTVSDLTVEEGAWLAAVVKAPTPYTDAAHPEKGLQRKDLVLRMMLDNGFLSEGQYELARRAALTPGNHAGTAKIPNDYIGKVIEEACSALQCTENELAQFGLTVYTYLDIAEQNQLNILANSLKKDSFDYCCVILDNTSRGIVSYYNSKNMECRRQPGSVIKPLLSYAAALEQRKLAPLTPVLDAPCKFGDYEPKNYQNSYGGYIDVRTALAKSSNVVAVKALEYAGVEDGIAVAERLGIPFDAADRHLAAALGGFTYGVTPVEIAGGYAALAGGGLYHSPGYIERIEDEGGNLIYRDMAPQTAAVRPDTAYLLTDMLQGVTQNGTARKLGSLPYEVAAKTGTVGYASGNSDAWASAYTSEHTMVVWCGKADGGIMGDTILGGTLPCETVRRAFETLYAYSAPPPFSVPAEVEVLAVDRWEYENNHVLKLAAPGTPEEECLRDYFSVYCRPTETATRYTAPDVKHLALSMENGAIPVIRFDAEFPYSYRITRTDQRGAVEIAFIENRTGQVEFRDRTIDQSGIYTYEIQLQWTSSSGALQQSPPIVIGKVQAVLGFS